MTEEEGSWVPVGNWSSEMFFEKGAADSNVHRLSSEMQSMKPVERIARVKEVKADQVKHCSFILLNSDARIPRFRRLEGLG